MARTKIEAERVRAAYCHAECCVDATAQKCESRLPQHLDLTLCEVKDLFWQVITRVGSLI